jgi:hypothetical protein
MHCAVARWPNTELLGKADDDVMLLLPSITAHLRGSLDELRRIQNVPERIPESPSMLWGVQESYHWDVVTRRPDGFDDEFSYKRNCMLRNPLLKHTQSIGPFNFAKGACLFVSMGLTRQLLTHRVKEEIEAAMAAADSISAPMRAALSHLENPRALLGGCVTWMGVDDHGGLRGGCLRPHWQTRLRRGVVQCRRRPRAGAFDAHPAQPRQAVGSPQAGAPLVAKAPLCAPVGTARVRGRAVHLVRRRHVAALHGQRRAVCGDLVLGTPPTLDPHSPLWLLIPTALCGS